VPDGPQTWDDILKLINSGGGTQPTKPNAPTNYTQQNIDDRRAALLATGNYREQLPNGFVLLPSGKAIGPGGAAYQKDNQTNLWSPTYSSKAEQQQALTLIGHPSPGASLPGAIANSAQPNAAQLPTSAQGVAQSGGIQGAAGYAGALGPGQGVTLPGFDQFVRPGQGFAEQGRQTLYDRNGLNTLNTGRQGSATQIPVTPGFRAPGQNGNAIQFASGASGGYKAEPQLLFPEAVASVPGTYVQGQGNVGDANRAYEVPFNIGPYGAGSMSIGGNNVQINSADKGTGYGFALNAMPASNVFAATGREGSRDPALQAAQTLQLNAALNQFGGGPGAIQALTATNPNQFGGFHAGTGNNPFSGNGGTGQAQVFGGMNPAQQAQNMPSAGIAPVAGSAAAVGAGAANAGQAATQAVANALAALADQRDQDQGNGYGPDGGIRGFAGGGSVYSGGNQGWKQQLMQLLQGSRREPNIAPLGATGVLGGWYPAFSGGGSVISLGRFGSPRPFASGGDVIAPVQAGRTDPEVQLLKMQTQQNQQQQPTQTTTQQPVTQATEGTHQAASQAGLAAAGQTATSAPSTYQPQSPEQQQALQPFISAAQQAAGIQHARDNESYIRQRAGLAPATGVAYLGQDNQNLAPGQYLDYGSWLNGLINNIGQHYQHIQELGGVTDPSAVQAQINSVNQQMDPYQQAQGLLTQIQSLGGVTDPSQVQTQINALNQQMAPYQNAQQLLTQIQGYGTVRPPEQIQQEIVASQQAAGPLNTINESLQHLNALGSGFSEQEIQNQSLAIAQMETALQQAQQFEQAIEQNPAQYGPVAAQQAQQQIQAAQSNLTAEKNHLSQMLSQNNSIAEATNVYNNLLQQSGLTPEQVMPQLAQYQAQQLALQHELENSSHVQQLQNQLANSVPNADPNAIAAALSGFQGQLTPLQTALQNATHASQLQGQLSQLVPNTDPTAIANALAGYQSQLTPLQTSLANANQAAQEQGQLSNLLQTAIPKFAGGGSMITPEEIVGIGAKTGRPYFRVGEPTRPGGPPRAEKLKITPLHRDSRPSDVPAVPGGRFERVAA